jgi:hypothetical protein
VHDLNNRLAIVELFSGCPFHFCTKLHQGNKV